MHSRARRVHLVGGNELYAAGATRCNALCYHLQEHARDEARLAHRGVLRGDGELGAKVALRFWRVALATRAAQLAGGQALSVRGRARATAVPKACAASPCSPGAATCKPGAWLEMAQRHTTFLAETNTSRRPAYTEAHRTTTASSGA
jgi:hypothetical protein